MNDEARVIARELAELGTRLADLSARVEELDGTGIERNPVAGGACQLLTAAEVVRRTGLPRGRVYQLARKGKLGAVRVGERGIRFSERGLAEWLRQGGSR